MVPNGPCTPVPRFPKKPHESSAEHFPDKCEPRISPRRTDISGLTAAAPATTIIIPRRTDTSARRTDTSARRTDTSALTAGARGAGICSTFLISHNLLIVSSQERH